MIKSIRMPLTRISLVFFGVFTLIWFSAGQMLGIESNTWDIISLLGFMAFLWCVWMDAMRVAMAKQGPDAVSEQDETVADLQARGIVVAPSTQPILTDASGNIRAFASQQDAESHGWNFEEQIGSYAGAPLFRVAIFKGVRWVFDGLSSQVFNPSLAESVRLFGRLKYKQQSDESAPLALAVSGNAYEPQPPSSTPSSVSKNTAS